MADALEVGVFALATLGMASAALGLDRHWRDLVGPRWAASPRWTKTLRLIGVACWGGVFILAVREEGAGIGTLLGITALTVGASTVALTLAILSMRKPRRPVRRAAEAPKGMASGCDE
ncbi:DUF3325 domain-containing protein [Nitrospirillum viridazoti]|uniref:DUF3325 domain-containing protein n=1 Tax=Nitrospirillum viridazoti CBAmc TaxID=1441467 RepID=A0A248K0Y0_9PROT|nr:DUF3325 domain-containing protein [Nitrospirillum amazonense]ASG24391.1 hypothetical protein Y958_26270 [Nitrospirillum amazonense CBAmc]